MDKPADPDDAAVADRGPVGLERAVLLRVALNHGSDVERDLVADADQAPLGEMAAVVEDPLAHLGAQPAPDQALERRAVEHVDVPVGRYLPQALVPPEIRVVNRAVLRLQQAETRDE